MPASVTIAIPTRRRRHYLEVALASIAGQAREHGAEIVVVEDDAADAATRALVVAHAGRYLALGAPRGINVARNACLDAARGDLVCFLDDDVEVWDGWLEALLDGAARNPGHEAFGGPIRPRLEGFRAPLCGREPPPVTALDLGARETDAQFAWGANLAIRRRAVERIGAFDPVLNYAGDEEEWLRRLGAAGGRIRYLPRAGVDHRRAGRDATVTALARAAWFRGRHARRWDARKGTAPGIRTEVRVLAGCLWHGARRRCANGPMLAAMAAGRLVEALSARDDGAPVPRGFAATAVAADAAPPDFLSGASGTLSRRGRLRGRALDATLAPLDAVQRRRLTGVAAAPPPRRVLALGVARPANAAVVHAAEAELHRSRHLVESHFEPGAPGRGKWANLNAALAAHPAEGHDWLLLVDDDVVLPRGFLDGFLGACERLGLTLAQPAHAFASHAAWPVTRRRPLALARETRFVEIGPVTAIARSAFEALLPFPDLRMGWGLDAHWGAVAGARGWPIGIVDATPIRHVRPVASDYPHREAVAEARAFLAERPYVNARRAAETVRTHRTLGS